MTSGTMAGALRVREVEIDRLRPWRRNPRRNDHAVDAVAGSIESFGFSVPILCDRKPTIVAGDTRGRGRRRTLVEGGV